MENISLPGSSQKGDKVYTVAFDGDKNTLQKMIDLTEQIMGLRPKHSWEIINN